MNIINDADVISEEVISNEVVGSHPQFWSCHDQGLAHILQKNYNFLSFLHKTIISYILLQNYHFSLDGYNPAPLWRKAIIFYTQGPVPTFGRWTKMGSSGLREPVKNVLADFFR